jgi:hypothetical protein
MPDRSERLKSTQNNTSNHHASDWSFWRVWSSGFVFLLMVALVAVPALLSGAAIAWIFTILMGWHGDMGFMLSAAFSIPFTPYIYGLALPHFRRFTKEKSDETL